MSSPKHIQEELEQLQSSLPFNNNQPFSVPEGYFEGLAATLLAKVKSSEASAEVELSELSPLLAGIPKTTPYTVPPSYFEENLTLSAVLATEEESSVLAAIGKEMPYSVPQGYFEGLPQELLKKVSTPKTKVVPLFARTWMRVAAAAVIAGAIFFAGSQLFNAGTTLPENTAANPSTDTSQMQVASNGPAIQKQIQQTSTKELEEFIETVQVNTPSSAKQVQASAREAKELLKDVSVNEMESFLSDLPADDEVFITD